MGADCYPWVEATQWGGVGELSGVRRRGSGYGRIMISDSVMSDAFKPNHLL